MYIILYYILYYVYIYICIYIYVFISLYTSITSFTCFRAELLMRRRLDPKMQKEYFSKQ